MKLESDWFNCRNDFFAGRNVIPDGIGENRSVTYLVFEMPVQVLFQAENFATIYTSIGHAGDDQYCEKWTSGWILLWYQKIEIVFNISDEMFGNAG